MKRVDLKPGKDQEISTSSEVKDSSVAKVSADDSQSNSSDLEAAFSFEDEIPAGLDHAGGGTVATTGGKLVLAAPIRTLVFHPGLRQGAEHGGRRSPAVFSKEPTPPSERLFTPAAMRLERRPEDRLEEAVSLAAAIHLDVVATEIIRVSKVTPATYLGSGKVDEIKKLVEDQDIELVIADCALSPVQQRNLERAFGVKVIDRTGLILEIFGERAQTREGRLQVELASLNYQKSRLVRSWTHLERQRGGLGKTGGPGETQIESDRRLIDEEIIKIKRALEQVVQTRELHRASRRKTPYPVVSLVGYTNAGKSSLFNMLTHSTVHAEDMLFATLDPTMRRLKLPSAKEIILSDTVGFISDLPTHLVAAFRATLEEVLEADIILHVRDIAHPDTLSQREDVMKVLKSLNVEAGPDRRIVEVLNKIDLLSDEERTEAVNRTKGREDAVALSARTGQGAHDFLALLDRLLEKGTIIDEISLPSANGRAIAWLYQHGDVLARHDDAAQVKLQVRMDAANWGKFRSLNPGVAAVEH
jgi:GTP-binding protein HflX